MPLRFLALILLVMAWSGYSDSLSGIEPDVATPGMSAAAFGHIAKLCCAHMLEHAYGEATPAAGDTLQTNMVRFPTIGPFVGMADPSYDANELFRRYEYRNALSAIFVEVGLRVLPKLLAALDRQPDVEWIAPPVCFTTAPSSSAWSRA